MQAEILLETRELTKEFKGFVAVSGVNLRVRRGTVHALIGPNGAGKTTVFNLLTKFLTPSAGQIFYKQVNVTTAGPAEMARRGIIRSFQISAVFPHMSALENVRIGLQKKMGQSFDFWRSDRMLSALDEQARSLLAEVGLEDAADQLAVHLPYGRKRALEIATTLALDPELMLLDEPTQGMGHEDVDKVVALIRRVSHNRTVLMVEHNMSVVSGLCDVISVLQRGQIIAEGPYQEVSRNPQVMEAYMGSTEAGFGAAHG
jgi:branched-chain amino acid transport system ATP-binding protein